MNLLIHELRSHLKSLSIWSATMVFLIYAGMMKYGAFEKTGEEVNKIFEQMPEPLLKVFGMKLGEDLTSVTTFYSIFLLYFMLLAAAHSTMLGTLIIAKEERDKTADFLLVKPIKRHYVITYKVIASVIQILILNAITYVVSVLATAPYTNGKPLVKEILYVTLGLLFIQFIFLGIGLLLGGMMHRSKAATGIGSGIIIGTFILKVLIDLNSDLDFLVFLTPFSYFSSNDLMMKGQLNLGYAALVIAATIACIAGTYYSFQRRDIHN